MDERHMVQVHMDHAWEDMTYIKSIPTKWDKDIITVTKIMVTVKFQDIFSGRKMYLLEKIMPSEKPASPKIFIKALFVEKHCILVFYLAIKAEHSKVQSTLLVSVHSLATDVLGNEMPGAG